MIRGGRFDPYLLPSTPAQQRAEERARNAPLKPFSPIPTKEEFEWDLKEKAPNLTFLKVIDMIRLRTWSSEAAFAKFVGKDSQWVFQFRYRVVRHTPISHQQWWRYFNTPKPKTSRSPKPLILPTPPAINRKETRGQKVEQVEAIREKAKLKRLMGRLQRITRKLP